MTMGVLAVRHLHTYVHPTLSLISIVPFIQPYRSRGLGSQSLELALSSAAAHTKPKIDKVYLHVQVSNDDAKRFYQRHGFIEVGVHKDYYKKIEPHDAWILERTLN
jgi:N-alpha-acetyltransferase 50